MMAAQEDVAHMGLLFFAMVNSGTTQALFSSSATAKYTTEI